MPPLHLTLDDERAAKLASLAERAGSSPDAVAQALLAVAIDEAGADLDGPRMAALLDAIPGARERAELARRQAKQGDTTPLDDLDA